VYSVAGDIYTIVELMEIFVEDITERIEGCKSYLTKEHSDIIREYMNKILLEQL